MQRKQSSGILQTEKSKRKNNKNAGDRRTGVCRIPTNHRQAERKLIKAIWTGELSIDNKGRIWRHKVSKGLRGGGSRLIKVKKRRAERLTGLGYLQIRNTINGKRINGNSHRLVWQFFNGDIPDGMCINHKNGIKNDNRLSNLEIVTYSENRKHGFRIGLINQDGEKNPNFKYDNGKIEEIRKLYSTGTYKQKELADKFNIPFQSISRIVRGETRRGQGGQISNEDHRGCDNYKRDVKTGRFLPEDLQIQEYPA